jgi:hypothetical protein
VVDDWWWFWWRSLKRSQFWAYPCTHQWEPRMVFGTLRFSAISTIYLHLLYIYYTSSPAPTLILKNLQTNCRFLDPQPISSSQPHLFHPWDAKKSRLRWEICVSLTESGFNQAR